MHVVTLSATGGVDTAVLQRLLSLPNGGILSPELCQKAQELIQLRGTPSLDPFNIESRRLVDFIQVDIDATVRVSIIRGGLRGRF